MSYWYEKENGELLRFEKECYLQFMREYNHRDVKLAFVFDKKNHFCVEITLPFKAAPDAPWRAFKFHIVYEHDHPGRGSDGMFGGSIKVYPLTKLKPGFHHMIMDSSMGLPYICQVRTANSEEVNGYKVMTRVLRWIDVYCIWERTGVDIDK
ncbi:hypothetical protein AALA00_10555 [Lachnospiraceae bacterium 46-15]